MAEIDSKSPCAATRARGTIDASKGVAGKRSTQGELFGITATFGSVGGYFILAESKETIPITTRQNEKSSDQVTKDTTPFRREWSTAYHLWQRLACSITAYFVGGNHGKKEKG